MVEPITPAGSRTLLLVLWLVLYASFALLVPPLLDGPDALHAEVAREMVARHDAVTLHANSIPLPAQPPMLYWAIAGSMWVFGVGSIPARFALAVFALLLFLLTEHVARRTVRSARAGVYAAVLLLLSFGTFVFTRILTADVIECLWLVAALYCFWQMEQQGERPGYLQAMGFAVACAAGAFTIGVVGIVVPLGIVLVYLLLTRGFLGTLQRLRQLHLLTGVAAFLLAFAPWYFVAGRANLRGWAWLRFLTWHEPSTVSHGMPLLFCVLLLMWMMPGSAFLWHAMQAVPWRVVRSSKTTLNGEQKTCLLLSLAALVPWLVFPFTTHHLYSVLPSMPFLAMLIGRWLDHEAAEAEAQVIPSTLGDAGQRIAAVLLVCGSGVALAWVLLPLRAYAAFFNRVLGWHAVPMADLHGPLQFMSIACFAGALAAWWLRKNYRPHDANIALALAMLVFLTATHKGFQALTPVLSSQSMAQTIQQKLKPDDLIVIHGNYEAASSLAFYLQRENLHLWHGDTTGAPTRLVETDQTMQMRWHGVQRVYVWTETGALPPLPGKVYVLAESGNKQIVSNRDTVY